ncbi:SMI1/KNR4 family protein [Acinetobacter pittii]|uniref:SMI1/KNR4 family protein n=1 Tax=Acinetobacter pittii TaxID=48296 RepID=UPI00083DA00C|nr:SMI1/KNR4 family protein [Acinetobacter pittii]MCK0912112.1 SMI1/KNR4 family protein [Acinetobacter pittii]
MSINDVDKAIALINLHLDEADFEGEKEEFLVKLAENYLEITFPDSYRYFLKKLGCGNIAGQEFYGVINEEKINSGIPDVAWITLNNRRQSDLPAKYIVFYHFGDGNYAVLDCEKNNQGNNIVEIWSPGENTFQFFSADFGSFFYNQIKKMFD